MHNIMHIAMHNYEHIKGLVRRSRYGRFAAFIDKHVGVMHRHVTTCLLCQTLVYSQTLVCVTTCLLCHIST